jgi:hypothetical protein
MPPRLPLVLLAVAAVLAGCGSSHSTKVSAKQIERMLEQGGKADVTCTDGSNGWDYTCHEGGRKMGVDVDRRAPIEVSGWVPLEEPLAVGPGGEGVAVHARFIEEASAVCTDVATQIKRLPRPVSRVDAVSRLDQVLDLRRQELVQLEAIKPPLVLTTEYVSMLGALGQVANDERQLRGALATRDKASRRTAEASRNRDAVQAKQAALRLGLPACANPAIPLPGIVGPH